MNDNDKKMKVKLSEIPLESSLGLLALGDIAFVAWREIKKSNNIHFHNDKEVKE